MKRIIFSVIFACIANNAIANDHYVQGYVRQNGNYVQPYYKTAPDNSRYNNYSTQGNVNPYTGQQGYANPYQGGHYPSARPVQPVYQGGYVNSYKRR